MTKYFEALKEYNKGKDKWCIPRKGTDDYKIIERIIEKNKVINSSYKEHKIKEPKVPKEPKIKEPKVPKEPKIKEPKVPKEPKIKEPKVPKEHKIKEPKVPNVPKSKTVINLPIQMKISSNKKSSIKKKSVFIKQVDNKQNANIIANFLRNKLIKDKYTLDNRVSFYKYINNLLVDINGDECLKSKVFKRKKGYTINNKINLYKKIGTESAYGVIYLTSIVNSFGGFTIASKVMPNNEDNINEIKIMKFITDKIILKKKSKHFVFMYKHAICNKLPFVDKRRIVCINELAHGDLKTLMETEEILKDDEVMMNLLFQTFISIGTFHNITGYVHKDTHYGNFLYQKNNEKGYYEYSFNGKSYYLKSCGYNIMIYDFGLSEEIKYLTDYSKYDNIKTDYARITCAFFNVKLGGWIETKNLPSDYVNDNLIKVKKIIFNTTFDILNKITKIKNQSIGNKFIENIIENIFIPLSPKGLWLTERPKNVINKKAFDIS
jgi:hypothetical protein